MALPSVPQALRMAVGTVGVDLLGAGFAIAFRMALRWGLAVLLHQPDVLAGFEALPGWERLALPAAGGLLAGLVATLTAQRVDGHGLTEVLVSLVLGRGELSLRTTLWKALASFCAIVTGGSIGREGPIIQFGAGAGSTLGTGLGLHAPQVRSLVAAGTAAGFAATCPPSTAPPDLRLPHDAHPRCGDEPVLGNFKWATCGRRGVVWRAEAWRRSPFRARRPPG
jgi:CIC family chloride channel protein